MTYCRSPSAGPTRICTGSRRGRCATPVPSRIGRRTRSTSGACACRRCRRASPTSTTSATTGITTSRSSVSEKQSPAASTEGRCPPEDCGGPYGYTELQATLRRPRHPDHEHMREWIGDRLRPFDLAATDRKVRAVVGEVPESVRLLLEIVGEGVKLTPGWAPAARGSPCHTAAATVVVSARPTRERRGGPAATRRPARHDATGRAAQTGQGVLRPTKAAADDRQVLRRLRSWFVAGSFDLVVAERAAALLVACGPMSVDDMAQAVLPTLGYGGAAATSRSPRTTCAASYGASAISCRHSPQQTGLFCGPQREQELVLSRNIERS